MQKSKIQYQTQQAIKLKNYKVKNSEWFCSCCDVYCNSKSQFEVHMLSTKHSMVDKNQMPTDSAEPVNPCLDSLSSKVVFKSCEESSLNDVKAYAFERSFSNILDEKIYDSEIRKNFNNFEIAKRFKIDAVSYLIPEEKRVGKFEKFGFYCSKCNAYMTGQIQLVMHIKGAKHQYFFPGEVPDYQPSKVFNSSGSFLRKRFNQTQFATCKNTNMKDVSNGFFGFSPFVTSYQSSVSTAQTILMAQAAAAIANQRRVLMKTVATAAAAAALSSSHNSLQNQQPYLSYTDYMSFNPQLQQIHTPPAHQMPQINPDQSFYRHVPHNTTYPNSLHYLHYNHSPSYIGSHNFSNSMPVNSEICQIPQLNHHLYSQNAGISNSNGYRLVQHSHVSSNSIPNSLAQVPQTID